MISEDTDISLPAVWQSHRRLIVRAYIAPPRRFTGMAPNRKGETVVRASYDARTHTFIPPVPEPDQTEAAPEFGGAA